MPLNSCPFHIWNGYGLAYICTQIFRHVIESSQEDSQNWKRKFLFFQMSLNQRERERKLFSFLCSALCFGFPKSCDPFASVSISRLTATLLEQNHPQATKRAAYTVLTLTIRNLTLEDEGQYTCRAEKQSSPNKTATTQRSLKIKVSKSGKRRIPSGHVFQTMHKQSANMTCGSCPNICLWLSGLGGSQTNHPKCWKKLQWTDNTFGYVFGLWWNNFVHFSALIFHF